MTNSKGPPKMPSTNPRNRLLPAFLSVMAGLVLSLPGSAQTTRSPEEIFYPKADFPIWVAATTAEAKSLDDAATFHPMAAERIRHILSQTPVAGCYEAGPIVLEFSGGRNPPRSFQDAARSYPVFAYGIVRELTPGFKLGEAGYLARLEVTQTSRGFADGQSLFVFLPIGDFTFHGKKICKKDPRYAGLPSVGDEILAFAEKPFTKDNLLLNIDYPEAVVIVADEKLELAPPLKNALEARSGAVENPINRDELLALLPSLKSTPYEEPKQ